MTEYWRERLRLALRKSVQARSPALREVHLRAALHYRSLISCAIAARGNAAATTFR
jgi:hypothetical protein